MKGISKKILAIIIAAILTMSVFAVSATAYEDDYSEDDYFYTSMIQDGIYYDLTISNEYSYATVSGYELDEEGYPTLDACVTIPETILYEDIEATVTEIGFMAFADCYDIREIVLPETIDCIYDYAFSGASHLEKVVIPETAMFVYFGEGVFEYTPALGYFAENSDNGEIILGQNVLYAYLGNEKSYTVPEEIDFIADYCFFMSGIEEITLTDNIYSIPSFAFASCRNLKEVTIPDSVTDIATGAFADCSNLKEVNLGDSLEYIYVDAFKNTAIEEIYLGSSIFDVAGAFNECNSLSKFIISEDNENYHFDGDALYYTYSYEDYDGTVYTESYIEHFIRTSDQTSFTVPESVTVIGAYAFNGCKNLKEVILTAPVEVWEYAFTNSGIEKIDFSKVSYVGYHSFSGCKNLTSADLSNVYSIDSSAFENCKNLKDVTFGSSIAFIGGRAFSNTAITEISIGGDYCEVFESAFANCPSLKRVNFNDGVGAINEYIFANCPSLERVYISKTVEYIAENAFNGCQNVTFELVKHSASSDTMVDYAEDENNDVTNYEFVDKLGFFERVAIFLSNIFTQIFDFLFGWISRNIAII